MTVVLTPADLDTYMQANVIPGEILYLDSPTPTVESAAKAVGTSPERIIKSILFMVKDEPVLALTNGLSYVDRRSIAALYGVGRKRVKLASKEVVLKISGYEVGAMPPFGHRQPLITLLDQRVLELPEVYAGGGADHALVRLNPEDILKATKAQVMDLVGDQGLKV